MLEIRPTNGKKVWRNGQNKTFISDFKKYRKPVQILIFSHGNVKKVSNKIIKLYNEATAMFFDKFDAASILVKFS